MKIYMVSLFHRATIN